MSHNARLTNTNESRRGRRHASSRARRRQPLFCFGGVARKLTFSGSLEWTEEALKCHARNSDGGAAIEVLRVFFPFWVHASVLHLFGQSSGLKNWACDRHYLF